MFLNEVYNDYLKSKNNNFSIKYFNQTKSTNEEAWSDNLILNEDLIIFLQKIRQKMQR